MAKRQSPLVVDNLRLKELAIVTAQNKPAFDYLVHFIECAGYPSLQAFVTTTNHARAERTILRFLQTPLPDGIVLYDGIARPYAPQKAKWLLLGWVFRDAPAQRLQPMLSSMPGASATERQAALLNQVRAFVGTIFPEPERWEWPTISEVILDRLEGSRRSIKGTLFETITRRLLKSMFAHNEINLAISDKEIRIHGETYDIGIAGTQDRILVPVKTRETMGGGHALLFTRDIHKAISVANDAGVECMPIIIAESWSGDLTTLDCKDYIYIDKNPNQLAEVERALKLEFEKRLSLFRTIK